MSANEATSPQSALTRRKFLGSTLGAAAVSVVPAGRECLAAVAAQEPPKSSFVDLLRTPDSAYAYAGRASRLTLVQSQSKWQTSGVEIAFDADGKQMPIRISSPGHELTHLSLRWQADLPSHLRCLGDHWERSYGDLAWRGIVPERAMPWYFATFDGASCHAYGVKTGAGALCFWQLDPEGVTLWLNLCNGGNGVQLGSRELQAAVVVSRQGRSGEDPHSCVRALCRKNVRQPSIARRTCLRIQ